MIDILIEPFGYEYMTKAILISAFVGATCGFLSCFLVLKGWSLMGDAMSHSVVPGVALAYILAFPFALGAFLSGLFAALGMSIVQQKTRLKEDATIGLVFTAFFAFGLVLISANPISVNLQAIILGNVLAISDFDALQVFIICGVSVFILSMKWKDLMLMFFDDQFSTSIALPRLALKITFFALLSAVSVAALQTVGACLVIAAVITPGAIAYMLTDRFHRLIMIAVSVGAVTSGGGAYLSYFFDGSTGGIIVSLQTALFLIAHLFAPKYGYFSSVWRSRGEIA